MSSFSPLTEWPSTNAALNTNRDREQFDEDAAEKELCSTLSLLHLQQYPFDPFKYGSLRGIDYTFGLGTLYASRLLRQSRQLQNNRPCPLECLPTELRVKIMEFTGDYHSLWSLISASPHYLNAFLGFRKPLLTMITIRELTARNVILCNQKTVSNPRDTPVGVQAKNIEWLDYKFKKGVEHTLTLQSNLHAALQTYYSQIESNSTLSLDVQQLKALRALEDVVTWLRFDSDLQRFYDQVSPPSDFEAADSLCVLMRESTFGSYRNVNNMDYLHDYHIWIKGHRTESEIWPARIAGVWWTCKPSKFPTQLDRLKAFQKYFPWCDIRTVPELRDYEARIWELTPSLCFLFENFEVIQLLRFTRNERP